MEDIKELIKLTLKNLTDKNLIASPENYEKEFFSIIKKKGIDFNEFNDLNNILNKLSKNEKKSLNAKSYREISKQLS